MSRKAQENRFHACFSYSTICLRFFGLCYWMRTLAKKKKQVKNMGITHNTGPRGSTSARCCMLKYRSRNKLPVGYHPQRQPLHDTIIWITHLKATQALTELLAELHVHFSLAHHMFAELLSRQTTLREERLPLCTALCCDLSTRCLCLLCGFA